MHCEIGRGGAERIIERLVGPGAQASVAFPVDDGDLFPSERQHLARACAARRMEFVTARKCARQSLLRLGYPPAPIGRLADGSPDWPTGIVGSISHSKTCCAAVVAEARRYIALGFDLEGAAPLEADLEDEICTPTERRWLDERPQIERGLWRTITFSAKEAVYKCQSPLTGKWLGFLDIELDLNPERSSFTVRAARNDTRWLDGLPIQGRFAQTAGHIMCAATIARSPAPARMDAALFVLAEETT